MKTKPQYEDKSIRQPIQGNTTAGYLMDGPPFKDKNCTQPSNGTSIVQSNWDVGHLPHGHIPLPNIFPMLGQMSVGQKPRQNLPNFLGQKTPRTKPLTSANISEGHLHLPTSRRYTIKNIFLKNMHSEACILNYIVIFCITL